MTRRSPILAWRSWLLAAALLAVPGAAAAQVTERIVTYDVHIRIEEDGALLVRERIDYDFGFEERHGIYRDLPVRYHYDDVYDRVFEVDVLEVSGSPGTPDEYVEEREGALLRIRIGDPDRTITGRHTYTIAYRVRGALNAFAGHDELYWNAVGTEWTVPIGRAVARVVAPAAIQRAACFAGYYGVSQACSSRTVAGDTASFAHDGLQPGGGLTVVVALPKGVVPPPQPILVERWSFTRAFALTPWTVGAAVGLLALIAVWVARLLWVHGRDRRAMGSPIDIAHGSVTAGDQAVPLFEGGVYPAEFAPPDDIRPGQIGVLVDEEVNPVDVAATIVDLAVRGYLRIEEIPKRWLLGKPDWRLVQLRAADAALLPYERTLLEGLFRDEGDVDLFEDDEDAVADLDGVVRLGVAQEPAATGPPGDALASVTLSALRRKFHLRFQRVQRAMYTDAARRKWFSARPDRTRQSWAVRGAALAVAGAALTGLAAWKTHLGIVPIPVLLGGLGLSAGARFMPRRTPKGTGLVRRVLGFRTVIASAETHMARWAESENVFYRFLPYAIVFGLADKWARAFAHLSEAASSSWYVSSRPFSSMALTGALDSFAVSSAGTLTSRPASSGSSGFGGGGSSGGGGGGGGGGSW